MYWLDTNTDDDALVLQDETWRKPVVNLEETITISVKGPPLEEGEFWADAIKKLKDKPNERLQMAERHLPLPGAFREAAIVLRSLIREDRNLLPSNEMSASKNLLKLHFYAAIFSMCKPYCEVLKQPGFNVFEIIPFGKYHELDMSWNVIGCNKLDLLNKTDKKLMHEVWEEPANHTTANIAYQAIWNEYTGKLKAHQQSAHIP